MRKHHSSILFALLTPILTLLMLTACCSEYIVPEDVKTGDNNVVVSISSRGSLTPPESDNEKIQNYWIVFTQNDKIVKIIKSGNLAPAVEEHQQNCELANGTYHAYAFANMTDAYLTSIGLVEGQTMSTLNDKYYHVTNGWNAAIPMSSAVEGQAVVIGDGTHRAVDIEVIRMLAKVEFLLTNSSEDEIIVKKIGLGPLTKSGASGACIPLMTYNDASALSFANDVTTEDFIYTLPTAATLPAGTTTPQSVSFYVVESTPNTISNAFSLSFNLKQGSLPEDTRYALLDKTQVINQDGTNLDGDLDKSSFIRRNDWLRIPIDLGSYEFKLEARSYPPIGGYPEVDVTQSSDGHYLNFTLPGTFSIRPAIRQYGTTEWIYLSDNSKVESYSLTVDDSANIFSKVPAKNGAEIIGAIKSKVHGTAVVTLTVTLKLSGGKTRTLTRKMYITV